MTCINIQSLKKALDKYECSTRNVNDLSAYFIQQIDILLTIIPQHTKFQVPEDVPLLRISGEFGDIARHNMEITLSYVIFQSCELTKFMKRKVLKSEVIHYIIQSVYFGICAKIGFSDEGDFSRQEHAVK